tara:strand:+ start:235 stop:438 length:204 start_codon:yes stop_codon:yes gene_type:complete
MTGPFKLKKGKDLKEFFKTELKDLRPNDKNVDLDKGENMPVKRTGFGPTEDTNVGNMMTRELEDTAE